jgi:hypothetical protein
MATTDMSDLLVSVGDDVYYEDSFRNAIEDDLVGLIQDTSTTTRTVDPDVGLANKYDFYGLLTDMGIAMQYWWPTMRMNGYRSPADYQGAILTILIPNNNRIDNIRRLQQTSSTITS